MPVSEALVVTATGAAFEFWAEKLSKKQAKL